MEVDAGDGRGVAKKPILYRWGFGLGRVSVGVWVGRRGWGWVLGG